MILRVLPLINPLCTRFLTHYEILGIPRTATKADIKKAYLDKAKECHPDLNPDNEKAAIVFQQIQEAHDVLLSSKQRAQYNHQMNQDKYYGGQHRPEDGSRRTNVKSHGVNGNRRANEDFHENHRVNQDNYQSPASQRKYYHSQDSGKVESELLSQADVYVIVGLVAFGIFGFVVVRMVLSAKEEFETGRHNKTKTLTAHMAAARRSITSGWGGIYADLSISDRPSQPLDDTHKLVWNEEKGKLVRVSQQKSESSVTKQPDLVELTEEPVLVQHIKPLTQMDIGLLKIEMSKKKSEYLAAKKEYNENLNIFNMEQEEKKKNIKKVEEFI